MKGVMLYWKRMLICGLQAGVRHDDEPGIGAKNWKEARGHEEGREARDGGQIDRERAEVVEERQGV